LQKEPKSGIIYLTAKQKRDYRVAALVIPVVPISCVPRRQASTIVAQSRFLGKWEAASFVSDLDILYYIIPDQPSPSLCRCGRLHRAQAGRG
jgi:hypothetical protein